MLRFLEMVLYPYILCKFKILALKDSILTRTRQNTKQNYLILGILSCIMILSPSFLLQSISSYPIQFRSGTIPVWPTRSFPLSGISPRHPRRRNAKPPPEPEVEADIKVLTAVESKYNSIVILDTPESKVLLLDSTHNVHSVFNKGDELWTQSYWDEFVTLPAVISHGGGPIAMFGLGGGTAAKLMLQLWPALRIQGWEIDEILVFKARQYLGLADLERGTDSGGGLEVRVGDALSPAANFPGGYAGIVVDLFGNGRVLPELEEGKTWVEMREKLRPGGRIMVNCGGISGDDMAARSLGWERNDAIRAMKEAFPQGELHWKKIPANVDTVEMGDHVNFMALTGPLPDLSAWADALPPKHREYLRSSVHQWRTC